MVVTQQQIAERQAQAEKTLQEIKANPSKYGYFDSRTKRSILTDLTQRLRGEYKQGGGIWRGKIIYDKHYADLPPETQRQIAEGTWRQRTQLHENIKDKKRAEYAQEQERAKEQARIKTATSKTRTMAAGPLPQQQTQAARRSFARGVQYYGGMAGSMEPTMPKTTTQRVKDFVFGEDLGYSVIGRGEVKLGRGGKPDIQTQTVERTPIKGQGILTRANIAISEKLGSAKGIRPTFFSKPLNLFRQRTESIDKTVPAMTALGVLQPTFGATVIGTRGLIDKAYGKGAAVKAEQKIFYPDPAKYLPETAPAQPVAKAISRTQEFRRRAEYGLVKGAEKELVQKPVTTGLLFGAGGVVGGAGQAIKIGTTASKVFTGVGYGATAAYAGLTGYKIKTAYSTAKEEGRDPVVAATEVGGRSLVQVGAIVSGVKAGAAVTKGVMDYRAVTKLKGETYGLKRVSQSTRKGTIGKQKYEEVITKMGQRKGATISAKYGDYVLKGKTTPGGRYGKVDIYLKDKLVSTQKISMPKPPKLTRVGTKTDIAIRGGRVGEKEITTYAYDKSVDKLFTSKIRTGKIDVEVLKMPGQKPVTAYYGTSEYYKFPQPVQTKIAATMLGKGFDINKMYFAGAGAVSPGGITVPRPTPIAVPKPAVVPGVPVLPAGLAPSFAQLSFGTPTNFLFGSFALPPSKPRVEISRTTTISQPKIASITGFQPISRAFEISTPSYRSITETPAETGITEVVTTRTGSGRATTQPIFEPVPAIMTGTPPPPFIPIVPPPLPGFDELPGGFWGPAPKRFKRFRPPRGGYRPSVAGLEIGKFISEAPKISPGIGIRFPVGKKSKKKKKKKRRKKR